MIGNEAFELWRKNGIALEALVPSTKMSDEGMDSVVIEPHEKEIAKVFTIGGHVGIPVQDFETVASIIQQTNKGVMVWFYFDRNEWAQEFPKVLKPLGLYDSESLHHSVTAVDFGLIKGKKYIKIEDSAHFGGLSERWISEEFFKARNFYSHYSMNFAFEDDSIVTPFKPKYRFTNPLEFIPLTENGRISDLAKNMAQKKDVEALQEILCFEGFFPTNIEPTGYYGAITAKGVYEWQKKHAVTSITELNSIVPRGGRIGDKSVIILNKIYG
jgi:hypothetical protein